jgi:uncharacterized protein YegL
MTDQNLTHLLLIADRSGSMSTIAADMNGGIAQLLKDQAKEPGAIVVDVWTFDDSPAHEFTAVRPDDIKRDLIVPRGMTALNDAIGLAVTELGAHLAGLDEDDRPGKVIVVVVTDGQENSSREWSGSQVHALITEQSERWGWTFIYLGANVDAFAEGQRYGFDKGQTMNYAATSKGAAGAMATASSLVTRTRSGLDNTLTDEEREAAL